ncbi:MAG TPA: preprotein translocase subunit YajC [Candidatus Avalokitesvara rifleensis]|uniref:preprotein translocase subunit YajC n=1 Tax=Candidatus Avalokitesvara rifleensis TaxID=3367620 RepID=UPI0027142CF3|nr:preprotein translocase subunit YajC [Candidatus Brocadiales bacterium]
MIFLAQAPAPPSALWTTMVPFMIMALVIYLFILRPQRVKDAERQEMLAGIKKNDRVITAGGIHGVVLNVKETELLLLIDKTKDVKVKIERDSVTSVIHREEKGDED